MSDVGDKHDQRKNTQSLHHPRIQEDAQRSRKHQAKDEISIKANKGNGNFAQIAPSGRNDNATFEKRRSKNYVIRNVKLPTPKQMTDSTQDKTGKFLEHYESKNKTKSFVANGVESRLQNIVGLLHHQRNETGSIQVTCPHCNFNMKNEGMWVLFTNNKDLQLDHEPQ